MWEHGETTWVLAFKKLKSCTIITTWTLLSTMKHRRSICTSVRCGDVPRTPLLARRATWIPCVLSQFASTRLRLGPIRAESGRLEFDLYLNPTSAHFTQTPKHKLSTSPHISSLTCLCALCLSTFVSSPLWLWDIQPLSTYSVYCFNSFFLQLSLTHS